MTKEERALCSIAKRMHFYGCPGYHCDFDENLTKFSEWTSMYNTANSVFISYAKKAVSLMNENGVSYEKFIKAYSNWNYGKHVSRKMIKLMAKYDIIKIIPKSFDYDD